MQTLPWYLPVALILGVSVQQQLVAATPDLPYHRAPGCIDGNCIPNRATSGYHATRWRPWPGGEPSQNTVVPPVGRELPRGIVPSRDQELDLPTRPTAPEGTNLEPSPNDTPGNGIVLPPELRDVTPKKPIEESLPGSSNLQRGPLFPVANSTLALEPLLLSKKPEPLRSLPATTPLRNVPSEGPPALLKIRPASNSQSGLMPEMVPWNDEDKNPIVRQTARISGNQVHQTINLAEARLPDANEGSSLTIRVQHENSQQPATLASAVSTVRLEAKPISEVRADPLEHNTAWHSPLAAAPAMLPNFAARPLLPDAPAESVSSGTTIPSPLRGLSQGNPLRQ